MMVAVLPRNPLRRYFTSKHCVKNRNKTLRKKLSREALLAYLVRTAFLWTLSARSSSPTSRSAAS